MSKVAIQNNRYTVESLYQWDTNQVLEISGLSLPSVPEIHFTNETMDRAIVKQATMDGTGVITVDVPNSLLQKPYKIKAYVCIYEGETFETLYTLDIPVKARKKPNDYTIEDDPEIYSFNALENKVNNKVVELVAYNEKFRSDFKAEADSILKKSADALDDFSDYKASLEDLITTATNTVNNFNERISRVEENKLNKNECVDVLTSENPNLPLSANMGRVLNEDIKEVGNRDYIFEQGSTTVAPGENGVISITWFYRKWNSGLLECWGISDEFSIGSWRREIVAYPMAFTEIPNISVTTDVNAQSNYEELFSNGKLPLTTCLLRTWPSTVHLYFTTADGNTYPNNISIHITAVGKWKEPTV